MNMNKYLIGGVVTLLVVAALVGAFFLGRGQMFSSKTPSPMPTTVTQTVNASVASPVASPSPSVQPSGLVNPSATIDAFQSAVTTGDYSTLPGYLADKITVIIYASSCCGAYTKTQTIQEMSSYLKNAKGPWDFSPQDSNSQIMIAKYPQYFKDFVIGVATGSRHVAAVHLDDQFKIDKLTLVVDYELITK